MTVTVRPLRRDDAPAVAALADEFADYLRALGDSGPHRLTAAAIERDGFGGRPAFAGLVAATHGAAPNGADELAGYLLYTLGYDADLAARNLFIIDLYVSPRARRQGAGRALVQAASDVCRAAGGAYLFWAVYKPNQLAADFYTALGARYVEDLDYMFIDTPAG
jgi:ribosomal protein S18 acetylase RimI-like enzyme